MAITVFRSTSLTSTTEEIFSSLDPTTETTIIGWNIYNSNAYTVYLKFYNNSRANTTVGTTTPAGVLQIPIGGVVQIGNINNKYLQLDTGLTIACVKNIADSDTTNPASGIYVELTIKDLT